MRNTMSLLLFIFGFISAYIQSTNAAYPYYGSKIGALTQLHHGVSGEVYAVDSRTLFVKNFNYDGEAPAAYFYVGSSPKPTSEGSYRLRDERGGARLLKRYRNKDVTLSLPEGKTLRDIKWFSVWCDEFAVNFGDVKIPANLEFPRPQKLSALSGVHGVKSDPIVIVDAQTLLVPNFSYDGEAPDAKFWVGRGQKPSPNGVRIPDENGKESPLRHYDRKTIVLTLTGDLTVFDIGHFGVWCEAFTVDFGHIRIPEGLNVPPSLKMLGISPQSKLNCEVLYDDLAFEVRWAVAGESVVVQLVAKLEDGEYMSFGISPNRDHTEMIGADAVVAWVDKQSGKGFAFDYFLDAKSQCSGKRGSCPDTKIEDNTNSIRLLNAAMVNGYSIVTYQRSLKGADKLDLPILVNKTQAIVWALGPLNQRNEVSFHSKYTKGDQLINFGRQPTWNCPMPEGEPKSPEDSEEYYEEEKPRPQRKPARQPDNQERRSQPQKQQEQSSRLQRRPVPTPKPANTNGAWEIPPIQCFEPEDGVFYAQMGPTGGKHGYPAITGHVGWGISWYINGLLIPEIHVVRGKTYTFVTEGGNDPDTPAKYHPFYITDDPIGGYEFKTDEEKNAVRIFAGVHKSRSGKVSPTGTGRLCNWTPDTDGPSADEYQSFGAYQRSLTLKCDAGEPGIISWTPDSRTPNTVYYHCFTHRHLGWKIHVHDTCEDAEASELDEVYAQPEGDDDEDILAEGSIRQETRVRPGDNFLEQHEKDLIKHHNMNETPPKVHFDLNKSSEITRLIADGIRAAEALEDSLKPKPATTVGPTETEQRPIPEILQGEILLSPNYTHIVEAPHDHLVLPKQEPAIFLIPPQGSPLIRPIKIAGRRPTPLQYERFPPSVRPLRPVLLPQPSVIVNHYKKSVPPFMRPFMKLKPFPIQPIASVLLLGQTQELSGGSQRKTEPLLKSKQKPLIRVPYSDSMPMDSKKKIEIYRPGPITKVKLPYPLKPQLPQMPIEIGIPKIVAYKEPVVELSPESSVTFKPAVNTGFKPDSVIVESGFKPILNRRSDEEKRIESEARENNRRQDDDIDEALEVDAPFYNQETQGPQSFEPMFIPSPPDSTNASIIVRKSMRPQSEFLTGDLENMEMEDGEDKMAVAAERLDTYYLPPETRKRTNIPDGTVVTFDGKAILDTSLVNNAPPRLHASTEEQVVKGVSKTEQLVRTPQFGPFRGERPPPLPDFLPKDSIKNLVKPSASKPLSPVTEYSNPLANSNVASPISTKLTLLSPVAQA